VAFRITPQAYPVSFPSQRVQLPPVPTAQQLEQKVESFGRRHHAALVLSVVALLTGSAITAVAVAPLVPDAADLPQRVITQTLETPSGLQTQLDALALQEFTLTRSDITRGTDSIDSLLTRLGVRDPAVVSFLRADQLARGVLTGRGGKMVQVQMASDGSLQNMVLRYPIEQGEMAKSHFARLSVVRGEDGRWRSQLRNVLYGTTTRLASGTITGSLFASTDEAGVPDAVAAQLSEIFSTDIDFHRQLRKGDTFSVVYETLTADGEPVPWNEGAGRVLAAEFVNGGREHHAVWFDQGAGKGAYYGIDGRSKRRSFLASPMEFSRISSGFAMRFHPIMQTWRRHLGVDYAAPIGTPVRTVGDGVVSFSGWQNGYGNTIEVDHGNGRTTLYAHLSRKDVRKGQKVQQGQRVGAVGNTGWSTGPHLHFEFRINGQHQDPLVVAKATETLTLDRSAKADFAEVVKVVQAKLEVAESLMARPGQFE
jgi:murein DD-endopeptidase MepM/ murein hydrolase activator NlpD